MAQVTKTAVIILLLHFNISKSNTESCAQRNAHSIFNRCEIQRGRSAVVNKSHLNSLVKRTRQIFNQKLCIIVRKFREFRISSTLSVERTTRISRSIINVCRPSNKCRINSCPVEMKE